MALRHAFGQTVRRLRLKAGISQERLALNVGLNRANTASLERGRRTPTLETVFKLLPGLHVTFVEFAQEFERTLRDGAKGRGKGDTKVAAPLLKIDPRASWREIFWPEKLF
jgi:transcriptional regulator with XRE-family HTH domain